MSTESGEWMGYRASVLWPRVKKMEKVHLILFNRFFIIIKLFVNFHLHNNLHMTQPTNEEQTWASGPRTNPKVIQANDLYQCMWRNSHGTDAKPCQALQLDQVIWRWASRHPSDCFVSSIIIKMYHKSMIDEWFSPILLVYCPYISFPSSSPGHLRRKKATRECQKKCQNKNPLLRRGAGLATVLENAPSTISNRGGHRVWQRVRCCARARQSERSLNFSIRHPNGKHDCVQPYPISHFHVQITTASRMWDLINKISATPHTVSRPNNLEA